MTIRAQIKAYIESLPEPKRGDMQTLHRLMLKWMPGSALWFLDGKNEKGKIVSNPNIGYGRRTMVYADGTEKEFYRIGISANTSGVSVYIMGLDDKKYLARTYGKKLGKADVTGYCIRFKALSDINIRVLESAVRGGSVTKNARSGGS